MDDALVLPCEHKFRLAKFVCWTTGASWPHDVPPDSQLESDMEYGVYLLPRGTVEAACVVCEDVVSDVFKKLSGGYASIFGSEIVNSSHAAKQSETQQQAHKLLTRLIIKTPYLSRRQVRKKKFVKKLKFQKMHSYWPHGSMTNSYTLSESIDAVARNRSRVTFEGSTFTTNNRRYLICGNVKYSPTVVEQTLTANPLMSLREVATLLCMNLSTLSKIMLTHKLSRIDELKSTIHVFATCRPENIKQQNQHHSTSNNNHNDDDYGSISATSSVSENIAENTLQTKSAAERTWMNSIDAVVNRVTREDAADAEIVALNQSSSNEVEIRTTEAAGNPEHIAEADAVVDNVDADVQKLPSTARRIRRLLQAAESMSLSQIATVLKVPRTRVVGLVSKHKLRRTRVPTSFSDMPLPVRTKKSKINIQNGVVNSFFIE